MTQLDDGLLKGKVVLVSGEPRASGLRSPPRPPATVGAVVVTGRRRDPGEQFAARIIASGGRAHFVACDVPPPINAGPPWRQTVEHYDRVDCLVNSAGLTTRGTLLDTTPELFDQHIAVNTAGRSSSCRRRSGHAPAG